MYCRLCLNEFRIKEYISLLSFADGLNWKKLCWEYLHIEIKQTDVYSKGICQRCTKVLEEFHAFCQHALHCQRLLPQLHLKLKETEMFTLSEQNLDTQTQLQLDNAIRSEPSECEKSTEIPVESDLSNQKTVYVVTETLKNENSFDNCSAKYYSKRLRISDEEDQATIVVKTEIFENCKNLDIPMTENVPLGTEELQTTLDIKSEPLDTDFDVRTAQVEGECIGELAAATESIKDENDFESTEYELHVPTVETLIARETPAKEFKARFKQNSNYSRKIEHKEHSQYMNQNRAHSQILQQVDSPFHLDEEMFRKIYRLSPKLSQLVIQNLDAPLRGSRITAHPTEKLVLAALRFYATGCCQGPVGELRGINMSQPAISRAIHKVTDAINAKMCQRNIRFPMTSIDRQAAKSVFASASVPFIGAIGAIDCMQVAILGSTGEQMDTYLNKDGYHSINVQMICDPTLKILNVNARYPGSKDNAYIWNASVARSVMKRTFENVDRYTFLIGDAKYPLEPWLMTPLSNPEKETSKHRYNEALFKARIPVQRLFGVLKATWRCLSGQRELKYNPRFAGRIVNACSVLHNLQVSQQEYTSEDFVDIDISQDNFDIGESTSVSTDLALLSTAKHIRNHIISNYYSN